MAKGRLQEGFLHLLNREIHSLNNYFYFEESFENDVIEYEN